MFDYESTLIQVRYYTVSTYPCEYLGPGDETHTGEFGCKSIGAALHILVHQRGLTSEISAWWS